MSIDLKAPTSWKDLSKDDFLYIVEVGLMHLTREERLMVLLCHFTGIRMKGEPTGVGTELFVTAEGQVFTMQDYEIADFCERLAWMVDGKPDVVPNPTRCDDFLRDMSFGDWFETDTQMRLLAEDNSPEHLAVVMPKLGEETHPMTEAEVLALVLWWGFVMETIGSMYPNVFEKSGPKDEPVAYNPFKQLQDFHLMLNDDRPQDNEKIDNARLHDVLSALDSKIEKRKREEAEYNKLKNKRR